MGGYNAPRCPQLAHTLWVLMNSSNSSGAAVVPTTEAGWIAFIMGSDEDSAFSPHAFSRGASIAFSASSFGEDEYMLNFDPFAFGEQAYDDSLSLHHLRVPLPPVYLNCLLSNMR